MNLGSISAYVSSLKLLLLKKNIKNGTKIKIIIIKIVIVIIKIYCGHENYCFVCNVSRMFCKLRETQNRNVDRSACSKISDMHIQCHCFS